MGRGQMSLVERGEGNLYIERDGEKKKLRK